MTRLQPAPDAVLHLVKCGCVNVPLTDVSVGRLDLNALIFAAAWMEGMSSEIMLLTAMKRTTTSQMMMMRTTKTTPKRLSIKIRFP